MFLRLDHFQRLLCNGQFFICWNDQQFHSRAVGLDLSRLACVLPIFALINRYPKGLQVTCKRSLAQSILA